MSGRIVRTDLALADLAELAEYIRQRNPAAALRFIDAAEAAFRQLATMPGLGEAFEADNPAFDGLRCMSISKFSNYIVYYKPLPDGIVVYRVLHGSQDRDAAFGQREDLEDS